MSKVNSEPQEAERQIGNNGEGVRKANKSCIPCRIRKIKCDATVTGIPCSNCKSRQSVSHCALPVRKGRSRKPISVSKAPVNIQTAIFPATFHSSQSDSFGEFGKPELSKRPEDVVQAPITQTLARKSPAQPDLDLLYLNILNDAVTENEDFNGHSGNSSTLSYSPSFKDIPTRRKLLWTKLPHLDDDSNEFLFKKGVFDLPPPHALDALVTIYFDRVYPFTPVINRVEFIRGYQSGDCSLFLLRVIISQASIHASADVLSECGFSSPSAAQDSFFSKVALLHDFSAEDDSLLMLQASIILCSLILDHPSDKDFGYWFHNAIRLATTIDLRNRCIQEDKTQGKSRLYRRIWWDLNALDIFHVFLNPRRSRLLENTSSIEPRTEDDWDVEDASESLSNLLTPFTPQQKALPVAQCTLSQTFGQLLHTVTTKPQQDPRQIMHPLDAWRKSLATVMHVNEYTGTDVYYLDLLALSYRYEFILCRLIRRLYQQPEHCEWAKQRLRSTILELDTFAMRVLTKGTFREFSPPFITTMTALLALHIETALDPKETQLNHSVTRISISQIMLLLNQGKDIPVLKRALPVFEEVLVKKNLYSVPTDGSTQSKTRDITGMTVACQQIDSGLSHVEQNEDNQSIYGEFLGLEFWNDWKMDSWGSMADVEMEFQG